jgi:hypothetical protein
MELPLGVTSRMGVSYTKVGSGDKERALVMKQARSGRRFSRWRS